MMRPSVEIKLSEAERRELQRLAPRRKVWRSLSDRVHIVLLAAEGLNNVQISNTLGINSLTARKWRNRLAEHGMDGLQDEPRPGCQSAFKVGSDSLSMQLGHTAWTRRALSRSRPARPYI